jgi:hypothetical protein
VRYRLRDGVLAQTALPRAVLLDSARGEYAEINAVGTAMLRGLLEGLDADTVAARIAAEFEVDAAAAAADCRAFCADLVARGLLEAQ